MAQPTAGALKSLALLDVSANEITDAGCTTLATALRGGALLALEELKLYFNPASQQAKKDVKDALSARQ